MENNNNKVNYTDNGMFDMGKIRRKSPNMENTENP